MPRVRNNKRGTAAGVAQSPNDAEAPLKEKPLANQAAFAAAPSLTANMNGGGSDANTRGGGKGKPGRTAQQPLPVGKGGKGNHTHKSSSQPRAMPHVDSGKGGRNVPTGVAGTSAPVRPHSEMDFNIMAMLNVQPPADRVSQATAAPPVPSATASVAAPAPLAQAQRPVRSRAQPPKSPTRGARRGAVASAGEQAPVQTGSTVNGAFRVNSASISDSVANELRAPVSPEKSSGLWSADGRGSPGGRDDHDGGSGDDDDEDEAAPEWWDCPVDGSDDDDGGSGNVMSPNGAGGLGMPTRGLASGFSGLGLGSSWEQGSLGTFLGGSDAGGSGGGDRNPLDLLPTPTPWGYGSGSAVDPLGMPGLGIDLNNSSSSSSSSSAELRDARNDSDWPLGAATGLAADAKPFQPVSMGFPLAATAAMAAPGPSVRLPSPSTMLGEGSNTNIGSTGSPFAVSPLAADSSSSSSIGHNEVWSMFGSVGGTGLGSGLGSSDLGGSDFGSDFGSSGGAFNDKWRSKLHGLYASPSPPPSSDPLSAANAMSPEVASPLSQHLLSSDSAPPSPEHYSPLFARALATPDPSPTPTSIAKQTVPATAVSATVTVESLGPAAGAVSDAHMPATLGPHEGGSAQLNDPKASAPSTLLPRTPAAITSPATPTLHVKGSTRAALKCDDAQKPTKAALPSPSVPSPKQVAQAPSKAQEPSGPTNGKKAQGKGVTAAAAAAAAAAVAVSPKEVLSKESRKQAEKVKSVPAEARVEEKPVLKTEEKTKQDNARTNMHATNGTVQAALEETVDLKDKASTNKAKSSALSHVANHSASSALNGQQSKRKSDASALTKQCLYGSNTQTASTTTHVVAGRSSPALKSSSIASPSARAVTSNTKPTSAKGDRAAKGGSVLVGQTPGAFAALLGESDDDDEEEEDDGDEKDGRSGSESEGEEVEEEKKGSSIVKSKAKSTESMSQVPAAASICSKKSGSKNPKGSGSGGSANGGGSFAALDLHQLQQSSKQANQHFVHNGAATFGEGNDASVMVAAEARLAAAEASARVHHPTASAPSLLAAATAAAAAAAEGGEPPPTSASTEGREATAVGEAGVGLEARLAEAAERGRAMGGNGLGATTESTNHGKEGSNSTGTESASSGSAANNKPAAGGGKKQRAKLAKWVRQQIVHTDVLSQVFTQVLDNNRSTGTTHEVDGASAVQSGASPTDTTVGSSSVRSDPGDNHGVHRNHHSDSYYDNHHDEDESPDELIGQRVMLHGLRAKPELNGLLGVVEQWVAQSGRYAVRLLPPQQQHDERSRAIDDSSSAAIAAAPRASVKVANLHFLGPHADRIEEIATKAALDAVAEALAEPTPPHPPPPMPSLSASRHRIPSPDEVEASLEELAEERVVYASALQRVARSFGVPLGQLEACANECLQVLDRYARKDILTNHRHLHAKEAAAAPSSTLTTTTTTSVVKHSEDRKTSNEHDSSLLVSAEERAAQLSMAAAAAAGVPADVRGFARRVSAAMSEGTMEGRELVDEAEAVAAVNFAPERSASHLSKLSSSYWPGKDTDRFGWLSDDDNDDDDEVNMFAPYPIDSAASGNQYGNGSRPLPPPTSRAARYDCEWHNAESRALASSLGMGEADCLQALSMHGGDVDAAARFLFSQPSFQAEDVMMAAAAATTTIGGGGSSHYDDRATAATTSNGPRLVLRLPEAGRHTGGERSFEDQSSSNVSYGDISDFCEVATTTAGAGTRAADKSACILLNDPRDVSLARVMQRAEVTGAQLPSGLKIPDQGHWVLEGRAAFNLDAPPLPPLPNETGSLGDDNHEYPENSTTSTTSQQLPSLSNEAVKKHTISPAAAAGAAAAAAAAFAASSGSAARSSPSTTSASAPIKHSGTPETGTSSGSSNSSSSGGLGAVVRPLHFPTVGDFGPGNDYDSDSSGKSSRGGDNRDEDDGSSSGRDENTDGGLSSPSSRRVGHTVLSVDERLEARLSPAAASASEGAPEAAAAAKGAVETAAVAKAEPLVGVPAGASSTSSSGSTNAHQAFSEHSGGALVAAPLKLRGGSFGPAVGHLHRSSNCSSRNSSVKVIYSASVKEFTTKNYFQNEARKNANDNGTHAEQSPETRLQDEAEPRVASDAWLDEVLDASLSDVLLPDGAIAGSATNDHEPSEGVKPLHVATTPPRSGNRAQFSEEASKAGDVSTNNDNNNRAVSTSWHNLSAQGGEDDDDDELHPPDSPPPLDLAANRGPAAPGLLRQVAPPPPPPLLSASPPPVPSVLARGQSAPSSMPVKEEGEEGEDKRKKTSIAVSPSWSGSAIPTWARQSAPAKSNSAQPQSKTLSSGQASSAASATTSTTGPDAGGGGADDELRHMTMSPLNNMLDAASLNDNDGDVQWVKRSEEEHDEREQVEVVPLPRARLSHLPPSPVTKSFTGSFSDGLLCSSPTNGKRVQQTASTGDLKFGTSSSPGSSDSNISNSVDQAMGSPTPLPQRPPLSKEDQLVASLVHLGIGSLAAERLVEDLGVRELSDFRYLRPDELAAVLEADESSSSSSSSSEESSSSGEDSDHFKEDSRHHRREDDEEEEDEAAQLRQWQKAQLLQLPLRGHGGFGVGLGMPGGPMKIPRSWRPDKASKASKANSSSSGRKSKTSSNSFGLDHQLEAVRRALASRGVVLGEAGPPAPNPDIVLTGRRSSPHPAFHQETATSTSSVHQDTASNMASAVSPANPEAVAVVQGEVIDQEAGPRFPTATAWTVPNPGAQPSSTKSSSVSTSSGATGGRISGSTSAKSPPSEAVVGAQMCRARLTTMESLKEKGNNLLLAQKLHVAKDAYSEAIDLGTDYLLRAYPDDEDDDDDDVEEGGNNGDDKLTQRSLAGEVEAVAAANKDDEDVDDEAEEALQHLMAVCLANRSLVSLKLSEAKAALWDAVQAERLSPAYGKAPLRRGAAREALGEWAEASEAYALAAQLDASLAKAAAHAARRCDAASRAHQSPSQPPSQHTAAASESDQGLNDRASNPWPKDVEPCDD